MSRTTNQTWPPSPYALMAPRVITPGGHPQTAAVVVDAGRVRAVVPPDALPPGLPVEDLAATFGPDVVLMPGLVDAHVHLNEPGRSDWEGFFTGSRAAAAGGVTTLADMPLNASRPRPPRPPWLPNSRPSRGRPIP